MNIPDTLAAGDSITWIDLATRDNLGNVIDSTLWTLVYEFRGATTLTLTATPYTNAGWQTTMSAAQSGALTAGVYYWQAYVTKGSDRTTLGTGQLTITPNLSSQTAPFDGRSQTQKDLEAVQTAIRAMISGGAVAEYSIGGRSLRKIPMADLIQLESLLKARNFREKKAEMIANGMGNPSNVFVRFK